MTQLQQLADRIEIGDLISRLGLWLDSGAQDDAAALLAQDVTVKTPGGRAQGREAVVAQARRNHRVQTQHVIANVLVELAGDRAEAGANLVATFAAGPGSTAVGSQLGERYRFELVRTPDGWRIAHVETRLRWAEGEPLRPSAAAPWLAERAAVGGCDRSGSRGREPQRRRPGDRPCLVYWIP